MIEKFSYIKRKLRVYVLLILIMGITPETKFWEYRWSTAAQAKIGTYNSIALTPVLIQWVILIVSICHLLYAVDSWIKEERTIESFPEQ